jgi:hypothetical protein
MLARVSTIYGANLGFEIFTKADFEGAGIDRNFGLIINLLILRIDISY